MNTKPSIGQLMDLRAGLRSTFNTIKCNPMDLNLVMDHIAVLSTAVDILISERVDSLMEDDEH